MKRTQQNERLTGLNMTIINDASLYNQCIYVSVSFLCFPSFLDLMLVESSSEKFKLLIHFKETFK